jgi:hypothetical protein
VKRHSENGGYLRVSTAACGRLLLATVGQSPLDAFSTGDSMDGVDLQPPPALQ